MVRQLKEPEKERIGKLILQAVGEGKLHAVAFGATDLDGEIYFGSAGNREIGSPSYSPINEDSIFWICSQTKIIVTVAGLQLVEAGKISPDTPVADIIPELANPLVVDDPTSSSPNYSPAKNIIRFRHLLNHSSGLYYDSQSRETPASLTTPYITPHATTNPVTHFYNQIKNGLPSVPLKYEPGTDFSYGYNVDTIGFIVERISGQTLEEYCKEHIFGPLGLNMTFYLKPDLSKRLVGLGWRENNGTIIPWAGQVKICVQDPAEVRLHLGGLGIYSTIKDFLAFLRHLLQIEAGRAINPILSVETVKSLFQPTLPAKGVGSLQAFGCPADSQWSNGLCINLTDWPGMRKKNSGCWFGWAGTYFMADPTTGVAAMLGTQVIPTRDPQSMRLWTKLERALYSSL